SFIARLFENLRDREILRLKRRGFVTANSRMARVHPRHQRASRRRASGRPGITLRETHPFPGMSDEVRGFNLLLAVAAQFAVTQIVRQNKNDVWLLWQKGSFGTRPKATDQKQDQELATENGTLPRKAKHDRP